MLLQLNFLLFILIHYGSSQTLEELYQQVGDFIVASNSYEPPTDNSAALKISDPVLYSK